MVLLPSEWQGELITCSGCWPAEQGSPIGFQGSLLRAQELGFWGYLKATSRCALIQQGGRYWWSPQHWNKQRSGATRAFKQCLVRCWHCCWASFLLPQHTVPPMAWHPVAAQSTLLHSCTWCCTNGDERWGCTAPGHHHQPRRAFTRLKDIQKASSGPADSKGDPGLLSLPSPCSMSSALFNPQACWSLLYHLQMFVYNKHAHGEGQWRGK